MSAEVLERPKTVLSLRQIGNSQGVVLPKSLLDGLDFSHGIAVTKEAGVLHLRPALDDSDPFGFAAAALEMIAHDEVDPLLIPDYLEEDSEID